MSEFIEQFKNDFIGVLCKSSEEYREFLLALKKSDMFEIDKNLKTYADDFHKTTGEIVVICVPSLITEDESTQKNTINVIDGYYASTGCLYSYSDIKSTLEPFKKTILRNGRVVRFIHNNYGIILNNKIYLEDDEIVISKDKFNKNGLYTGIDGEWKEFASIDGVYNIKEGSTYEDIFNILGIDYDDSFLYESKNDEKLYLTTKQRKLPEGLKKGIIKKMKKSGKKLNDKKDKEECNDCDNDKKDNKKDNIKKSKKNI